MIGCTNLDVDINSVYTQYPSSDVAMEAKLADTYYCFRAAQGQRYNEAQELGTLYVGLSFDGDYVDAQRYSHPTLHNYSPQDIGITYWQDLAGAITKCNLIIEEMKGTAGLEKAVFIARTMRAYYHFIMMDSYGDVPLMDGIPADDEVIDRKPRKEVAQWIEKELLECINAKDGEGNLYLTDKCDASTYGKPNRWMAKALLAKLYINWAVYTAASVDQYDAVASNNEKLQACIDQCNDIINSGLYNLSDSYRSKFYPDNGSHIKDFIYVMPFDAATDAAADKTNPSKYANSGNGLLYGRYRTFRKATDGKDSQGNTTSYWGGKISKSLAGIYSLAPEWADVFDKLTNDDRKAVILKGEVPLYSQNTREIVAGGKWTYDGQPVIMTKTITLKSQDEFLNAGKNSGWSQGYKSIKFWLQCSEYDQYNRYQSNDLPIFRYADILLTKCEAMVRAGKANDNGDTPLSLFNQIRNYVHADTHSGDVTLQDLFEERIREFIDENWARNDFIRFGHFEDEFGFHKQGFPTASFDKRRRILPVPLDVLNSNSNWKQNLGY